MQSRDTVAATNRGGRRVESCRGKEGGGRDEERKWENRGMKMGDEHRRGVEAGTIYRGREGAVIGSK